MFKKGRGIIVIMDKSSGILGLERQFNYYLGGWSVQKEQSPVIKKMIFLFLFFKEKLCFLFSVKIKTFEY